MLLVLNPNIPCLSQGGIFTHTLLLTGAPAADVHTHTTDAGSDGCPTANNTEEGGGREVGEMSVPLVRSRQPLERA